MDGTDVAVETLLAEMDRLGVERASVYHILAREYDPETGNARLSGELAGESRLDPVWVVMPDHTGEAPPAHALVTSMIGSGVRLARMFPAEAPDSHRYSVAEWCAGELLGALEERRIPLLLDFGLFRRAAPPWPELHGLLERHPSLPVVLMDIQGRNNRSLYALMTLYSNLYIQTGGFDVHEGIEDVCDRFGPQRLIFGSGYPRRYLGAALYQLARSGLSESDRQLIAADNLESLLEAVQVSDRATRG